MNADFFKYSFSVSFTVVCFRYYIKIVKRGVNVAKKKSKYIQMRKNLQRSGLEA